MELSNKVIWITGASSGIGEALAYQAVEAGATVIISARRVTELERVRSNCGDRQGQVHIVPLDLTEIEAMKGIADAQAAQFGRIDVLINNGGISQRALAWETSLEVDRRIMEVNYFGQVALTKAVLPQMRKQQGGHIAVVTSVTGKFGFPLRSAYAASKHALHGFFETLMLEMEKENIGVTLVNPGRVKTNISLHALTKEGKEHGEMDPGQDKGISAKRCAKAILRGIRRNKKEINIGRGEVLLVYLKRYLPGLFRWIAGRVEAK